MTDERQLTDDEILTTGTGTSTVLMETADTDGTDGDSDGTDTEGDSDGTDTEGDSDGTDSEGDGNADADLEDPS